MAKKPEIMEIDGKYYRVSTKTGKPSKVPLTRCSNTMTETEFKAWVLSGLRDKTKRWKPAQDAWKIGARPNSSGRGRHKIEHQCKQCKKWYPKKTKKNKFGIELDHIEPIGGLSDLSKLTVWVERAFVETDGYQKLCTACHREKTNRERKK